MELHLYHLVMSKFGYMARLVLAGVHWFMTSQFAMVDLVWAAKKSFGQV